MRKPVNGQYSAKLKAIRPFVNFDYDLRKPLHSSQKRKINRYFEAIKEASAGGKKVYRSRNKKRVRAVQRAADNEFQNLPDVKVAFYDSPPGNPRRVRFTDDGRVRFNAANFNMEEILIPASRLATDPENAVNEAIEENGTPAKFFQVKTGKHRSTRIESRNTIGDLVARWVEEYSPSDTDPETLENGQSINHRWENWLHGLWALETTNQNDLEKFALAENKRKAAASRKADKLRKRINRATKNKRR